MPIDLPPYYVDISGVFLLQKDFVGNLAGKDDIKSRQAAQSVSGGLNKLYTDFISSGVNVNGVLERQNDMLTIVNTEQERLNQKTADIDNAMVGKQRAVQLNNSYRQKYRAMMKIVFVIIVTLLLFILITFLSQKYPFIPSFVFEILSIIIISFGIFIIYFMSLNILRRSPTYFDQLYLQSPATGGTFDTTKGSPTNWQDLTGGLNLNQCIGSTCCDVGTHWDAGNVRCVGNTVSMFTTIQQSYNIGDFSGRPLVKANSPNEYDEYTPV